jgi:amino acid adenylation domain-containing protein
VTHAASGRLRPGQLAEIAARLGGGGAARSDARRVASPAPAVSQAGDDATPLSSTQHGLWLAGEVAEVGSALNVPVALRLSGPLVVTRLEASVSELVRRHPVLRIRLDASTGDPRQRVVPHGGVQLRVIDLIAGMPHDVTAAIAAETARPFDLSEGGPFRASLLRMAANEHVLLLVAHHIACDGWSMNLAVHEILDAYHGDATPEPVSFLDYCAYERSPAGMRAASNAAEFWAAHWSGVGEPLELPFARDTTSSDVAPGEQAISATVDVDPATVLRIGSTGRELRSTVHAVWVAAFAALLHCGSGGRRIPVGIPSANRADSTFDGAIGPFVTTLPLALPIEPGRGFAKLVERVTDALIDGAAHEAVSLDHVRERLGHGHPAARSLTDVMVVHAGAVELPSDDRERELVVRPWPVDVRGAQNALTCVVSDAATGLRIRLDARGDRYSRAGLRRLADAFEHLLPRLLDEMDRPLLRFDLTTVDDRRLFDDVASRPPAQEDAPTVVEAIRTWSADAPDAPAVAMADGSSALTYVALVDRATAVAGLLARRGVAEGSVVALRMRRTPLYPISVLACWMLGAVVVPLRIDYPRERICELLELVSARHLMTDDPSSMVTTDVANGVLIDWASVTDAGADAAPIAPASAARSAYIVFTSGSTGQPKPVLVSHTSLANELAWRRAEIRIVPDDRLLQTIPLAFDPSMWQCFGPLTAGASVRFLDDDLGVDPQAFVAAAVDVDATIVDLVPTLLAALDNDDLHRLPARVVFCGGEALPSSQAARYLRRGRGSLHNQYGPSETCIDAASHRCEPGTVGSEVVPIGRPISGARLYVLDDDLRPVPVGTKGDLCIGGTGVAVCYVGQPRATAEAFVPDPFSGQAGARMYRSGDRVRWTNDGYLEFLGRRDRQVKIRGHRVELHEIETALSSVAGVAEAAVVPIGDPVTRLAAFAVGEGPSVTADLVRGRLAAALPSYMVPATIRLLESLPATSNGKVDQAALVVLATTSTGSARTEARSPGERLVLDAFRTCLSLDVVSMEDDLYSLGGASLGAARIASHLRARGVTNISVRTVLENPGVATLSRLISTEPATVEPIPSTAAGTTPPASDTGAELGHECSCESLHVRAIELAMGRPAPAIPIVVDIPLDAEAAAVSAAIRDVAERHRALSPIAQQSAADAPWRPCRDIEVDDAEGLIDPSLLDGPILDAHPGIDSALLTSADAARRRLLIRLARNRGDVDSLRIVAHEIGQLLAGETPAPAPDHAEYVAAQRRRLDERRGALDRYWSVVMGRTRRHDLFAASRGSMRGFRNIAVDATLPPATSSRLAERCAEARIGPSVPYLTAMGQLARSISGHDAVLVASPVSRRWEERWHRLVGRCTDLLPILVEVGGEPSDLLPVAHSNVADALDHADMPFLTLVEAYEAVPIAQRPPLVQLAVVDHAAAADLGRTDSPAQTHWADLDLILHVHVLADGGRHLTLSGASDLFEPASLIRMLDLLLGYVTEHANEGGHPT